MSDDDRARLAAALEPLPTSSGGTAIVVATAANPPAMALLSTGDVHVDGDRISFVTYRGSSVARRLGGGFSLLVPAGGGALRVEAIDAEGRSVGKVELIEGQLSDIRPTAEPPWLLEMKFRPEPPTDPAVPAFVAYWTAVREWLASGAAGDPPRPAI